jgi:uncharacterized membrane protein YraQ (UPF0718 family)
VLPAAASLKKLGANKGATTAFLIATPESGIDSMAITYALLDPIMTVARPIAAFITAISAGFLENLIDKPQKKEISPTTLACPVDNCCDGIDCDPEEHRKHHTIFEKTIAGLKYGMGDVWGDIAVWFFVGLIIAGSITAIIPDDLMARYLGGGLQSMVIMLVFGVPIYICATASTPVAAALILKGVSPGAALVFLLAGPGTNITSLSTMYGILGRKATFRYLTVLSVFALLFGLLVDKIYLMSGIVPKAVLGEASDLIPHGLKLSATIIVLLISIKPVARWTRKKLFRKKEKEVVLSGFPVPMDLDNSDLDGHDHKNCGCGDH